ncbi:MAG: G5 domain-containing protein [Anaerolineales bacterium]
MVVRSAISTSPFVFPSFYKTRVALATVALPPIVLAACVSPQATAATIDVEITVDGETVALPVPAGSTVQFALDQGGAILGELDRVDPPSYAVVTDGTEIEVTRRIERFEVEELVLPFSRQTIRNEGLPEGQTRLLQAGSNGLEEITYRIVEEEGDEMSRQPVKRTVVAEPLSEIIMIGAQAAHTPLNIKGTLAYLSGGNAWVIDGNSANRRPVVVSGDLDGQIFRLSPDSEWLLYTRGLDEESDDFNSLWVINIEEEDANPINLKAQNIVHFADWAPESDSPVLAYSTAEPRQSPPGWQANNDLILVNLSSAGHVLRERELLPANPGGQYGWWGTSFAWAPDGVHIGYARADSVGLIDSREPAFEPLHEIVPLLTGSDWAWVPGVAWGPNSRTLYLVDHALPLGIEDPAASPAFDLVAISEPGESPLPLVTRTGMFAYPSSSPVELTESGEIASQVAFLQALSPLESETSSYRLMVMDRDGSNVRALFPKSGEPGIAQNELSPASWSPDSNRLALIYRGDVWIVDAITGAGQQLTGDGLTIALDWKP